MRKNLKKILCDYRQNCLFVVKYNKVVKIITDTSNCAFVFVNNKMYGFEIYVRYNRIDCVLCVFYKFVKDLKLFCFIEK